MNTLADWERHLETLSLAVALEIHTLVFAAHAGLEFGPLCELCLHARGPGLWAALRAGVRGVRVALLETRFAERKGHAQHGKRLEGRTICSGRRNHGRLVRK